MRLLKTGKVKDIYALDDGETILFHFSDRVSAFDVKMHTPIPRKGEVLCKFGEFWFNSLNTPHHMLEAVGTDKMIVKKLSMIPMECIVRGYFYGSMVERYDKGIKDLILPGHKPVLASKLSWPIFDPTTKSEEHDLPITKGQAIASGVISEAEYEYVEKTCLALYEKMSLTASNAGFIMADVKFEFGRDSNGELLLADSLGPDEYRLWLKKDWKPGRVQESYDKQLLRDWLIKVGFKDKVDFLASKGAKPEPPILPDSLVRELSRRYIFAFERIVQKHLQEPV